MTVRAKHTSRKHFFFLQSTETGMQLLLQTQCESVHTPSTSPRSASIKPQTSTNM